ncbi:hypothetical protein CQA53_06920 [Helicobacter didelphidarum]|uniref:Pirin family protein n=1 Tax=Helicobacter didelphidarum TaxID=2040648 RepID=A0A3D8II04_9HELI|nr:pirin-like bicupin family protein [Helicobacter didelphidarum]RDU64967.1 hypothetical protein CQA53_06920 [Helicobacter didelphidarum]
MKTIIDKADSRGFARYDWLETYRTFSFANYHNPERMGFGALRVLNDDIIAPKMGFDMHPHRNMEIVTIPLYGKLRHGDSLQNAETITYGDIQVMSAGSGIVHSEYNASESEPVGLLQIWILPKTNGGTPRYNSFDIRSKLRPNELCEIIAPDLETALGQDTWFFLGEFEHEAKLNYTLHSKQNGVYMFVIEGKVSDSKGDLSLERRDGAGIYEVESLAFNISKDSKILLIEVPM